MKVFIYLAILALNVIAIFVIYRFLGKEMPKKEKGIFIAVGIAIMYILVSIIYGLSTSEIEMDNVKELGQNLITFTFVPLNAALVMPALASSYRKFKLKQIKVETFRNRCILLAVILFILLIIEFFYIADIQNGVVSMIQNRSN